MLISSNNKNPLINFERKHRKHQKSQNPIGSKFSLKCMKNEIKLKKKGKNSLTSTRRQKSWRKFEGKRQKKLVLSLDRSKRERIELFEKLNSEEHVKNSCFKKKTLWTIFDWSKNKFNRSKITFDQSSIDRARQIQTKFLIAISFGQATSSIDRKSRKIKFLKNKYFNAETPQSTIFYEQNAWVWDEKFFKHSRN